MKKVTTYIRKLFEDKDKKIVVMQKPNIPIISWVLFAGLAAVLPDGKFQLAADLIAFGSLFTWAWLELFQGVNIFRRILGAIVLVVVIATKLG